MADSMGVDTETPRVTDAEVIEVIKRTFAYEDIDKRLAKNLRELRIMAGRLLACGPWGHAYRPIDPESVKTVERANEFEYEEESRRSLRCWNCGAVGDRQMSPSSPKTWGDHYHETHEAYHALKALVDPAPPMHVGTFSIWEQGRTGHA